MKGTPELQGYFGVPPVSQNSYPAPMERFHYFEIIFGIMDMLFQHPCKPLSTRNKGCLEAVLYFEMWGRIDAPNFETAYFEIKSN